MKIKFLKKIALYTLSFVVLCVLVLAVHIYVVYRPKAPTADSRAMARIDIKQPITQSEANSIASWMMHQKGVDHVLVNPQSDIVVFTFLPIKTTGDEIVQNFKTTFRLKAERFVPTASQIQSGCPAASSFGYKVYQIITNII